MKAQLIYDLQQVTGFISGAEMHNLFLQLLSDPSPKGDAKLPKSYKLPVEAGQTVSSYFNDPINMRYWFAGLSDEQAGKTRRFIDTNSKRQMRSVVRKLVAISQE